MLWKGRQFMAVAHEIASTLNELIRTCRDGENGFRTAAEALKQDPELARELQDYSGQRREFAAQLQNLVGWLDQDKEDSGSAAGVLHRAWINLRSAISSKDRYAILAECERGEDSAVETYRKAIESGLPSEYEFVVQTQFDTVRTTHDRVKALRDMAKPE
jgi:uncharacterized protein (TIGR02284 family)